MNELERPDTEQEVQEPLYPLVALINIVAFRITVMPYKLHERRVCEQLKRL